MGKLDEYLGKARDAAGTAGDAAKNVAGEFVSRAKELAVVQDALAGKEIKQGISELEALPEFEGSIVYRMELDALISDLKSMYLLINDKRLDDPSVAEEITKVINKVRPSDEPQIDKTDEEQAIDNAKAIAYSVCVKALEALSK